jgi:enamine deaminase RidA (YjgF/YER057c/UK114 family)
MQTVEETDEWLGASVPTNPPEPIGAYRAVMIRGGLGFVSGQFPLSGGVMMEARGDNPDTDTLKLAAGLAARNVAAQILKALGSWDRFAGLCRVDGIIASHARFTDHAAVLDGASETFISLFGPVRGAHARSATSSPSLPGNAAIELVVTFAVTGD